MDSDAIKRGLAVGVSRLDLAVGAHGGIMHRDAKRQSTRASSHTQN